MSRLIGDSKVKKVC